jgi:uncharacterized membrane protein
MMKRKLIVSIVILSLMSLMTTVVLARSSKSLNLQDVSFSLGSLIATGDATGLGSEDTEVTLKASGTAVIICMAPGSGNEAPGQNPKVSATGSTLILAGDIDQNGRGSFLTETDAPTGPKTAKAAGCPNNNWDFRVDFVFWDHATITVKQSDISASFEYTCTTTRNPDTVTCTPVK